MSTKTISFRATEDQIHLIDRLVEDGDYTSRGELIRSLLRKIEEKELSDRAKKDIEEATDDAWRGQNLDPERSTGEVELHRNCHVRGLL